MPGESMEEVAGSKSWAGPQWEGKTVPLSEKDIEFGKLERRLKYALDTLNTYPTNSGSMSAMDEKGTRPTNPAESKDANFIMRNSSINPENLARMKENVAGLASLLEEMEQASKKYS